MVEIESVTVSKTGIKLFDHFSFRILPGENWVIAGANGSGKTTLLQLISGSLHPTSGKVHHSFIQGNDWDTLYQQRLEKIHFIPTHWLQTFVSGFGGLFYQQRYYTMDETELPKVRDVFGDDIEKLASAGISDSFNIEKLLDLHITRLSNGQLKKVIILRQLVKRIPRLLLLDYPYDGLDAESRRDFNAFIDHISVRFNIQIILVDHGTALPRVMNRKLILDHFQIEKTMHLPPAPVPDPEKEHPSTPETGLAGEPVVEMHDLTIAYSGKKILSNLSWRINKGERWALTGKNGSGKTTLFSLIYADHPMAYSQKVFLFGKRRGTGESIWDIKKRINYFGPEQIHFLNPKGIMLTAREYIRMQPGRKPTQLNELITFFNAGHYIDLPVQFLSSGQLQLALLMNMLMDEKELLLLDEPFQFLDPDNHNRITQYLNRYLHNDITLVMITHDEKDVARWTQKRKRL